MSFWLFAAKGMVVRSCVVCERFGLVAISSLSCHSDKPAARRERIEPTAMAADCSSAASACHACDIAEARMGQFAALTKYVPSMCRGYDKFNYGSSKLRGKQREAGFSAAFV